MTQKIANLSIISHTDVLLLAAVIKHEDSRNDYKQDGEEEKQNCKLILLGD